MSRHMREDTGSDGRVEAVHHDAVTHDHNVCRRNACIRLLGVPGPTIDLSSCRSRAACAARFFFFLGSDRIRGVPGIEPTRDSARRPLGVPGMPSPYAPGIVHGASPPGDARGD
mmetsp:Transcript_29466/g.90321  ORF Transcript_29466/g.90321 Transcript_29466/m.90321 type:complete len:114 (+) Transcript_29466:273-614(+)